MVVFGGALAIGALTGCADDATVECLANDGAEVCARSDGAITFSASGIVGTEFVFDVAAIDAQGDPLTGQIVIASN